MNHTYNVPLACTNFCNPDIQPKLAEFVRSSQRLSYGEVTQKYEQEFSTWLGTTNCIAVNSGSSANLAIIQAMLELKLLRKGDCVGVSSVTWSTNIMPIIQLGLRPIPLDIAEEDLNITLESLCMSHKKFNLKALFITHLLGFCSRELDLIVNMCRNEGIILLEDTCESMGSVYQNKKLGTFGLASSFSTFVGHHYSTVEGGLICTDNEEFADTLRSVISHGWRRHRAGSEESIASGELAQFYSRYTFHTLGYNLRPTEISSYCGVLSLEYIDHICQQRHVNYKMFVQSQELNPYLLSKGINGKHMELCSNFAIPVVVENSSVLAEFLQLAESYGVESRPLVAGNIMEHPFTEKWVDEDILIWADANLPIAKRLHLSSCYLPNRHNLTERQRCTLIRLLNSFQYTKK